MSNHGMTKAEKRDKKAQLWESSKDCAICNKPLPSLRESTLDHIVPYSLGGSNEIENLQLAHVKCNNIKGNSIYSQNKKKIEQHKSKRDKQELRKRILEGML